MDFYLKKKRIIEDKISMSYIKEEIKKVNNQLLFLCNKLAIKNINFVGLGNSLTSGYSLSDITKPFLQWNKSLFDNNTTDVNYYSFSRNSDNCFIHLYNYLVNNCSLEEIKSFIRFELGLPENLHLENITNFKEILNYLNGNKLPPVNITEMIIISFINQMIPI